ncbi:MAG: HD domain-containing phosphohydrolase [Ignavibacteria bacterium]
MKQDTHVSLKQFVFSLSQALDLINPAMADHHKRVAYIALRVAEASGFTGRTKEDVVVAAALHDIGGLSGQRLGGLRAPDLKVRTAHVGYQLLQKFKPFRVPANIVRFQHVAWAHGDNGEIDGKTVPMGSHIVHLANLVNSLVDRTRPMLAQADDLCDALMDRRGHVLVPDFVDAFLKVSGNEAFWLDLNAPNLLQLMSARTPFSSIELDIDGLQDFAELLAQLIDFRSRFTATHSSGVAASAATLAQLFGFPEADCRRVQVAGYLHDLGKLAIPTELLEKQGKLTDAEWQTVRTHPYYTYQILASIEGLSDIACWSGMHHERLRGTGYPFRASHAEIPLEARILTVADVFTALTEDRPYRDGLDQRAVLGIIEEMVERFEVDRKVYQVLKNNYEVVDCSRVAAQTAALSEYTNFMEGLTALDLSTARAAHVAWKRRLRSYLDGRGTLAVSLAGDHRQCDLGCWYYGDGLRRYGHLPEMRELEKPHAEFHRLIGSLVDHLERQEQGEAEACYARIEPLSDRIVELLQNIEVKATSALVDEPAALH